MTISLELLSVENKSDIYNFEVSNRDYFETVLPPRAEKYYSVTTYNQITQTLLDEQYRGECFLYVIRNDQGEVIGRINYSSIRVGHKPTAEIGYRISEKEQGKGYATIALKKALSLGFNELGFVKVEAGTAPENLASQRVLEKNGFRYTGHVEKVLKIRGKWSDGLLYEIEKADWHNE